MDPFTIVVFLGCSDLQFTTAKPQNRSKSTKQKLSIQIHCAPVPLGGFLIFVETQLKLVVQTAFLMRASPPDGCTIPKT
jgi:uncharacterized membrane protein